MRLRICLSMCLYMYRLKRIIKLRTDQKKKKKKIPDNAAANSHISFLSVFFDVVVKLTYHKHLPYSDSFTFPEFVRIEPLRNSTHLATSDLIESVKYLKNLLAFTYYYWWFWTRDVQKVCPPSSAPLNREGPTNTYIEIAVILDSAKC